MRREQRYLMRRRRVYQKRQNKSALCLCGFDNCERGSYDDIVLTFRDTIHKRCSQRVSAQRASHRHGHHIIRFWWRAHLGTVVFAATFGCRYRLLWECVETFGKFTCGWLSSARGHGLTNVVLQRQANRHPGRTQLQLGFATKASVGIGVFPEQANVSECRKLCLPNIALILRSLRNRIRRK